MTSYSEAVMHTTRQDTLSFRWRWAWVLRNLRWYWEQLSESGFEDSFWLLVAVVSQTISWVICLAACLHYRPRKVSAPCRCGSESKFMTSHVPRPAHETIYNTMTTPSFETRPFAVWFRYYWQPSCLPSTPNQRLWFHLHLGQERCGSDPVRWSLVVQYGADRSSLVRVYITNSNQFEQCRTIAPV